MIFQDCMRKELTISKLTVLESIDSTFADMDELLYKALKDNIARDGLRSPIIVMSDEVTVVGGKHRMRAAAELGWGTVSCLILPEMPLQKAYEVGVLDNTLRRRLSTWEMTIAVNALYHVYGGRHGGSKEEAEIRPLGRTRDIVASLLGIGKDKVEFYRDLGVVPQQIWPELAAGEVSDANLWALVGVIKDAKKRIESGDLTQHELDNAVIATIRELIEFRYDSAWIVYKLSARTGIMSAPEKKKSKSKPKSEKTNKWLALVRRNRELERFIEQPENMKIEATDVPELVEELRTWSARYLELAQRLEGIYVRVAE